MSGKRLSSSVRSLVASTLNHPRYKQLCGKVRKYRCRLDSDDLLGELNLGIATAMHSVKMTRGSPMEYLLSRGFRHVQSVVSKELNHNVIEECAGCNKQRPYRREPCTKCGGRNFLLHPRYVPLVLADSGLIAYDDEGRRISQAQKGQNGAEGIYSAVVQALIQGEIRHAGLGVERRANQRIETYRRGK